jgi:hypothetical protein
MPASAAVPGADREALEVLRVRHGGAPLADDDDPRVRESLGERVEGGSELGPVAGEVRLGGAVALEAAIDHLDEHELWFRIQRKRSARLTGELFELGAGVDLVRQVDGVAIDLGVEREET